MVAKKEKFSRFLIFPLMVALIFMMLSILSLPAWSAETPAEKPTEKPADVPEEVLQAKQSIKSTMLQSHIRFLASKYCEGRETGTEGMNLTHYYINTVLGGIGITPAGEFGGYSQPVALKNVCLDANSKLQVETRNQSGITTKNAKLDGEFLPIILSAETSVTAPVVFAGYGITAPEHKYDDYKGIDATGKIVLIMRHEPGEKDAKSVFDGKKNSKYGTLLHKIKNAQEHGAVGILLVTDPKNHKPEDREIKGGNYSSGAYWPIYNKETTQNPEEYKYRKVTPMMRLGHIDHGITIPAAIISGKLGDHILGHKHSLETIQTQIDKTNKPNSFALNDTRISMDILFKTTDVDAYNIVAKIEGSDPKLKDEVVIVGAHYDHVGKDGRDEIRGGADDNASGTSAVMEMMRAFKSLKNAPKRTILFILFTAEEKGLYGSRYYVDNPILPLEKTIAMFNLDMIGRNDVSQLHVLGKYQSPKLFKILENANKKTFNFEINLNVEDSIRQSDQFPFMKVGIPCIFLTSALHDEYHTPRDRESKLVPEKIERISQLTFLALWETANAPAGTTFKK